ncbi:MAG: hypothetical protein JW891_11545 [Candidatus Lokiarchaeota archaeon]|nr:hypothetical protein [Candidatus Lokiarchaeota archaeon]
MFRSNKERSIVPSGEKALDEILSGGFHRELVYLIYGDKKRSASVLLSTSVEAQKACVNGGIGERAQVAFIDGTNRFNPYDISKYAVSQRLSPQRVLENILVARAFTWDQMIEILENRLSNLEGIKVLLVSGITCLLQNHDKRTFEDLLRAIGGIKKALEKSRPLIVLTAPLNEYSLFRPEGGKILAHFGSVLVLINDNERFTEYTLVQHPYLPERRILRWKPRRSKRPLSCTTRNAKIDNWF